MKRLIISHLIVASLLISWWVFPGFWEMIDIATFRLCHRCVETNPFWQRFWAILSNHRFDWIHDVVFFAFFAPYLFLGNNKRKKALSLIVGVVFTGFVIFSVNKMFFPKVLSYERYSPTMVFEDTLRLKSVVKDISFKDRSTNSYPGDHATTAVFFAYFSFYFLGWRRALFCTAYAIFFCMPRLVAGAHWFTDIVMGSFPIAVLSLSYFIGFGFFNRLVNSMEHLLCRIPIRSSSP
ncbi:MAG: phosphatase PAP2 family protein [Simkaniaceae bacterium]|nr:phosphatase PAP2 family protein [Simkaniaceae bacterium]